MSSHAAAEPFTMIFNYVLDDFHLCPPELSLYTAIARHVNHQTGLAWPSYKRLMELTGMARATISKYLKVLERKRLIQIIRRFKPGTHERAVNQYRLLDPRPAAAKGADRDAPSRGADSSRPNLEVVHAPDRGSSNDAPQVVHAPHESGSRPAQQAVQDADRIEKSLNNTRTQPTDLDQRGPAQSAGSADLTDTDTNTDPSDPTSGSAPLSQLTSGIRKNNWNLFCHALADTCQLDFDANTGKIRKFASLLWQHGKGYTAEDLKTFETWWYEEDWRGKKGDVPRLDEVVQNIRIAVDAEQIAADREIQRRYRYITGELSEFINY